MSFYAHVVFSSAESESGVYIKELPLTSDSSLCNMTLIHEHYDNSASTDRHIFQLCRPDSLLGSLESNGDKSDGNLREIRCIRVCICWNIVFDMLLFVL